MAKAKPEQIGTRTRITVVLPAICKPHRSYKVTRDVNQAGFVHIL